MNKKDLSNIEYIVMGLLRDMPRHPGFGEGYYAGVRQMQNAVRLLVAGDGVSLDSIVHQSRKLGLKLPKKTKRHEAYERAMAILNNRPGIANGADLGTVRSYDGPVIAGWPVSPAKEGSP